MFSPILRRSWPQPFADLSEGRARAPSLDATSEGPRLFLTETAAPAWTMQGVSTVFIGIDGNGTPDLKAKFARYSAQGIGPNVVSYVGFGAIRHAVIGEAARAPTPVELAKEKALVVKGMCEGAIG